MAVYLDKASHLWVSSPLQLLLTTGTALPPASDTLPISGLKKPVPSRWAWRSHTGANPQQVPAGPHREAPQEKEQGMELQGERAERERAERPGRSEGPGDAGGAASLPASRGTYRGRGARPWPAGGGCSSAPSGRAGGGRQVPGTAPPLQHPPRGQRPPRPPGAGRGWCRAHRGRARGGRGPGRHPSRRDTAPFSPHLLRSGAVDDAVPLGPPTPLPPRGSSAAAVTRFAHVSPFAAMAKLECVEMRCGSSASFTGSGAPSAFSSRLISRETNRASLWLLPIISLENACCYV